MKHKELLGDAYALFGGWPWLGYRSTGRSRCRRMLLYYGEATTCMRKKWEQDVKKHHLSTKSIAIMYGEQGTLS